MSTEFHTIGLIGKPHHQGTNLTLKRLHHWLKMQGYDVLVEERVAAELGKDVRAVDLLDIGEHCDLAIVVGGDGNMLGAARVLARFDLGVIGVNRGNLGFLTDLRRMPLKNLWPRCWMVNMPQNTDSCWKPRFIATVKSKPAIPPSMRPYCIRAR